MNPPAVPAAPASASAAQRPRRRWLVWTIGSLSLTLAALFTINGVWLAHNQVAIGGVHGTPGSAPTRTVKVMAWNLAKCFAHLGGVSFADADSIRTRLEKIAATITTEKPDLLFLSEVLTECTPCDVDQLAYLREHTALGHWAFGENYNFGLPFCRVVGGNAILSRFPLEPIANPDLSGRRPFYATFNNRRVLLADATIGTTKLRLAALHTDSFDLDNNLRQTAQILKLCEGHTAMLAGDFNAQPHDASMALVLASDRFTGALQGEKTWPAEKPRQRIDYIFAPRSWQLVEHRVIDERTSDHRPVVSVFRLR